MNLKAWAKEPLVHFLAAGGVLFLIAGAFSSADEAGGRTIHINRGELLVYLQARAQVYDEDTFAALLDNMGADERAKLVRDTALQEALYREGMALNITQADPLVRQRVVQQMRLLLSEEAARDVSVSEADVRSFYEAHISDYALLPSVSFSHIFFSGEAGKAEAQQALTDVRKAGVTSENAGQYGERFLYQIHYAEAGAPLLASHFGVNFAAQVFAEDLGQWSAPIASEHGWHLVLLRAKNAGEDADYDAIEPQVREDALADRRQTIAGEALDTLLDKYSVELDGDFAG